MKGLLPKLTAALEDFKERAVALTVPRFEHPVPPMPTDVITQEWFWPRVAGIFRPHDVIVAETGTSYFGLIDVPVRMWGFLWQSPTTDRVTSSQTARYSWRRCSGAA
jgi:TPP-dependent 2-oxoacid decarboxylase